MGADLQYLIDRPFLLIVVLFVGAMIGIGIEKHDRWQKRRKWQQRQQRQGKKGDVTTGPWAKNLGLAPEKKIPDAADQLRTVMKADFKAQPLLNKSEARLFKAIDKWVIELRPGWQVMAQVSLGEILRCEDKDAYACINSKRVDLLIVDADCKPIHAIEYQGGAHFKGAHATAARDAVKKEGTAAGGDWLCRGGCRRHTGRVAAGGGEIGAEDKLAHRPNTLLTFCKSQSLEATWRRTHARGVSRI